MSNKEESTVAAATTVAVVEPQVDTAARAARLDKLLHNHLLAASGVGLVPIPIVDLIGVTGVQLDLIKKISEEYKVPFENDRVKSIISALLGSIAPIAVGGMAISLAKCIPLVGQSLGALTMPAFFYATTYAVHKVFVRHYEAGGTILDFDASKAKNYFKEQFFAGKAAAATEVNTEKAAA